MANAATVTVRADQASFPISRHLYGQFAEHLGHLIYGGIWVGTDSDIPNTRGIRDDVAAALRKLSIPNLRWPGGCFADEYHWRDGVGPRDQRPARINTNWGGVVEPNHFGTHEFLDLCDQIACEPYLSGNVGSGSVEEMHQWIEYLTFAGDTALTRQRKANGREEPWTIKFFGVGNESWGCGGDMTPEYYSDVFRRYGKYCRDYSGNEIFKIACGANATDYNWTDVVMAKAHRQMDGLSLHYYTTDWGKKGSATKFDVAKYFQTLSLATQIDGLLTRHSDLMDKTDPQKRIPLVVDEWGTWYDVEPGTPGGFLYQQNTVRDAMVAGMTLNIFHKHAERVRMANIAQVVNVLQAMILTDGPRMLLTPTYHVFELYKPFQDATNVPTEVSSPHYLVNGPDLDQLSASACKSLDGTLHLALCNLHHAEPLDVEAKLSGASAGDVSGRIVTGDAINAHNTFDQPDQVVATDFGGLRASGGSVKLTLPPHSVVVLSMR